MVDEYPVEKMVRSIRSTKNPAVELRNLSRGSEAVDCIFTSIKMLKINISNMADLVVKDRRR